MDATATYICLLGGVRVANAAIIADKVVVADIPVVDATPLGDEFVGGVGGCSIVSHLRGCIARRKGLEEAGNNKHHALDSIGVYVVGAHTRIIDGDFAGGSISNNKKPVGLSDIIWCCNEVAAVGSETKAGIEPPYDAA